MIQRGQIFELETPGSWAYRYRLGGRDSQRIQRGGFPSQQAAAEALQRALDRVRYQQGRGATPTLNELADLYLAQHEAEPETLEKLAYMLRKASCRFGELPISQLQPLEIAAWRMTIPPGHRFEATQALRQTLRRAVEWGLIDRNPAVEGVENPQRRRTGQRPFESWAEIHQLAERIGPRYGPMVVFAAATGLRPGEWLALELRDIDLRARVVYVRRALRNGRLKLPKTNASFRAVPLQAIALEALDSLPRRTGSPLLFPAPRGGHLDLHNFRYRDWKPAQRELGIDTIRRVYDLRHLVDAGVMRPA